MEKPNTVFNTMRVSASFINLIVIKIYAIPIQIASFDRTCVLQILFNPPPVKKRKETCRTGKSPLAISFAPCKSAGCYFLKPKMPRTSLNVAAALSLAFSAPVLAILSSTSTSFE